MIPRRSSIAALALLLLAGTAQAQHAGHQAPVQPGHQNGHGAAPAPATPYAGMERRPIKALSEQQIADLKAGRGMGLALPAELNGYPGPIHVLELAGPLSLTEAQTRQVEALHAAMKAEAVPLGEALIAQEAELDRLFADKVVTPVNLASTTRTIGATQAALRAAHLKYHLSTLEVLTPAQVRRYGELRGYGAAHLHGSGEHRPQ